MSRLSKILKHSSKLNNYVKQTNWWRNKFTFTSQFNKIGHESYQIVNLGSNPARFCFFYNDVCGQNWSTGTQGQNMDLAILHQYHHQLANNAVVMFPLVPFSFVTEYLNTKPAYRNYERYLKYTNVLDTSQIDKLPFAKDMWGFLQSPLNYRPKAWKYLINDEQPDRRLEIAEQMMQLIEIEENADMFIRGWKSEFDITDLSIPLPEHLVSPMDESVDLLVRMIDFCFEREYRPVIVLPPMTSVLHKKFPESFWQTYIYDGIVKLNRPQVPVLDYMHDEKWAMTELYFNCYFMNLHGRKEYTKQVLKDVGLK